jgi:DNA processing protein
LGDIIVSSASSASDAARTRQWLALSSTPGVGLTRTKRLLQRFGDVERVFRASLAELGAAKLPAASAQSIVSGESMRLADEELRKVQAAGATLLVPDDPAYPRQLLEIYDPPAVLRVQGEVAALSQPGIAIVGTRHPTPYGLGMAERLACDLAVRGLIIFSGMARGVDSAAHRGAVNAKAKTVAVFGAGIDIIYPRENQKLSEQILANGGALVSEFPMGASPAPQNFPIRNRVISGLSRGVLVVEAGEYSGTRITARCALEQCREVFAVPGNVTNKLAWGTNTLIKQGAKLVATWEDVWEELPTDIRLCVEAARPSASDQPASLFGPEQKTAVEGNEKKVYALIKADESIHIDQLVEELEGVFSSSEIFAALFELELSGRIRQLPGKNYVRTF